jgi:hypothetical protein
LYLTGRVCEKHDPNARAGKKKKYMYTNRELEKPSALLCSPLPGGSIMISLACTDEVNYGGSLFQKLSIRLGLLAAAYHLQPHRSRAAHNAARQGIQVDASQMLICLLDQSNLVYLLNVDLANRVMAWPKYIEG